MRSRYLLLVLLIVSLSVTFSCKEKKKPKLQTQDVIFEDAKQKFEEGNYELALEKLESLSKFAPPYEKPRLHFMLGRIYFEGRNDYRRAGEEFVKEIKVSSASATQDKETINSSYYNSAFSYYNLAKVEGTFFNTILNLSIDFYNDRLYFNKNFSSIANIYETQTWTRNIEFYQAKIDYIHFYRALNYFYRDELELALSDINHIDRNSEIKDRAELLKSVIHYKQMNKSEVEKLWSEIIDKSSELLKSKPLYVLEFVYMLYLNNIDWNKDNIIKAVNSSAIDTTGWSENDRNRFVKYMTAINLYSGKVDSAQLTVSSLNMRLPEVVDIWGKDKVTGTIYKTDFYDVGLFLLLSNLYYTLSVKYYEYYISATQGGIDALMELARCYFNLGNQSKAIQTYKKVLEFPTISEEMKFLVMIELGTSYYKSGDKSSANKLWETVEKNGTPAILSELGYTYARLRINLNKALSFCQKVGDSNDLKLIKYLGYTYFQVGVERGLQVDALQSAVEYWRQDIHEEGGYSLKWNNPFVLATYSDLLYVQNSLIVSSNIYLRFRDVYPEAEAIFRILQANSNSRIAIVLTMSPDRPKRVNWKDIREIDRYWF